jgi:hypothetical protein
MKKNNLIWFLLMLFLSMLNFSCDDRLPTSVDEAVEQGSLELAFVSIDGTPDDPTIVGEVLSEGENKTSIVVIARLLDADGAGVNEKSLSFSTTGVNGSWDTDSPSTKFEPNFKRFGFPDLGGNGFAYAMFTPEADEEQIETASNSGAIIKVKYTTEIIDNIEFSVFK